MARCQHPPEPSETGGVLPAKPPGAVEGGRQPRDYAALPDPSREPERVGKTATVAGDGGSG